MKTRSRKSLKMASSSGVAEGANVGIAIQSQRNEGLVELAYLSSIVSCC